MPLTSLSLIDHSLPTNVKVVSNTGKVPYRLNKACLSKIRIHVPEAAQHYQIRLQQKKKPMFGNQGFEWLTHFSP